MAAYAKAGTSLYRDLSLAEYPYSLHALVPHALPLIVAPLRGPNSWPLRATGDPHVDAHTQSCDRLHRSAAGGALLGQTLDLLIDGDAVVQRCQVVSSRYAPTGELEYLLQPLGDEGTVVGAIAVHPGSLPLLVSLRDCDRARCSTLHTGGTSVAALLADVFGTGRHLRAHNDAPRRSLKPKVWSRLSSADKGPPTATTVSTTGGAPRSMPLGSVRRVAEYQRSGQKNHSMLHHISEQASLLYFGDNDCIFRDKR